MCFKEYHQTNSVKRIRRIISHIFVLDDIANRIPIITQRHFKLN